MRILTKLNMSYYVILLALICTIPYNSTNVSIFRFVLFFLILGVLFFIIIFYGLLSFNKKYTEIKKYLYLDAACLGFGFISFVTFSHALYLKSVLVLPIMYLLLFLISIQLQSKIRKILSANNYSIMKEVNLFFNMSNEFEGKPLMEALKKIDRLLLLYCAAIGISLGFSGNIYILLAVVIIVLFQSIKPLNVIKTECLNSKLVSIKETYFFQIFYYFCYTLSFVIFYFFPNMTVLFIGATSQLFIKIYVNRLALKIYDDKNNFS